MRKSCFVSRLLMGIILSLFIQGCALFGSTPQEEPSPAQLMSEGLEYFNEGYFEGAEEKFQIIRDRYPYSKFAVEAELKMADALFHRDLYDEALDAYGEFERLHPKNPSIPYVIYQRGICNFSRVSTIDRDQGYTSGAKKEFERLVKRFPRTEYADKARRKIRECYINLAEYELYVGNYYFKMGKYKSAMNRYHYILENYPDLGQYHVALESIAKCKKKLAAEEAKHEEPKGSRWFR
ncbi:MAG: outer membrane protein assembly factor BamD [Desulfobacterales bacterium]|nr:outer membrane protein assembly factor BamD [Desulfobacterales bacterium]